MAFTMVFAKTSRACMLLDARYSRIPLSLSLLLGAVACAGVQYGSDAGNDQTFSAALSYAEVSETGHVQRRARLRALSTQSLRGTPTFYEYIVSKKDVPNLASDTGVLRIAFDERVFFDTDIWELRSDAQPILDVVSNALRQESREIAVYVAGHTDSRGSKEYNFNLSEKRAESVVQGLMNRGAGKAKLWGIGFGKEIPLKPNDSPGNMAINRRVEFILGQEEAVVFFLQNPGKFLCDQPGALKPEFCVRPPTEPQKVTAKSPMPIPKELPGSPTTTQSVGTQQVQRKVLIIAPPTKEVGAPLR
jgi:outer membrane protein OmpA-like peptidoglycan-associated protein